MELSGKRIVVTGGSGFLGRAVCSSLLNSRGVKPELLFVPRKASYDLTEERSVARMYADLKPDVVFHLAAEVGGIGANMNNPGRFFYANASMGIHLVEHARLSGVQKFIHTGTVCAYPKHCKTPFKESAIWDGYPEETNAPYGVAKKALFVMLDAYRQQYGMKSSVVVPVNLYGPGDNFSDSSSHVIPAIIKKCCAAADAGKAEVVLWGSGLATREFLHVADAAEGIVRAAEVMDEPVPINLSSDPEIEIKSLASMIAALCRFEGDIVWDLGKPDGQPRRTLDVSMAKSLLGWQPKIPLYAGLKETIEWWRRN